MIIKVKKTDFIPHSKKVRFGYDDVMYHDLFGTKEHLIHFYPAQKPNEFLVCLDEINREHGVGTVHVLDTRRPGNKKLIKEALLNDYGFNETDYIVTFE